MFDVAEVGSAHVGKPGVCGALLRPHTLLCCVLCPIAHGVRVVTKTSIFTRIQNFVDACIPADEAAGYSGFNCALSVGGVWYLKRHLKSVATDGL